MAHPGWFPNAKLQEDLGTASHKAPADSCCAEAQRKSPSQEHCFGFLRTDFFPRAQHPAGPTFMAVLDLLQGPGYHSLLVLSQQESTWILTWLEFPHGFQGYPEALCLICNYLTC